MEELKNASFKKKESYNIPENSKVISKEISVSVEEIENGFLLTKNINLSCQRKGKDYSDHFYITKKYFSKDNPLEIDLEKISEKTLADNFSEEKKEKKMESKSLADNF